MGLEGMGAPLETGFAGTGFDGSAGAGCVRAAGGAGGGGGMRGGAG